MRQSEREQVFLDAVCAEVRWRAAHPVIRTELANHIEDQKAALLQSGLSGDSSEEQTLRQLGEPEALGLLFDASYRPAATFGVLAPVLLYALLGIVFRLFVYQMSGDAPWRDFFFALVLGGFGIALLFRLNLYRTLRLSWIAYAVFFALVVVSPAVYSAILRQTPDQNRPYETLRFLWMLFPLIYGLLLYHMRGLGFVGILAAGALIGVPVFTSMLLYWSGGYLEALASFACLGLLISAIRSGFFVYKKWLAIALLVLGVLVLTAGLVITDPYRLYRILAVLNPARDPQGDGWLVLRIRELITHAALFGAGDTLPVATQEVVSRFGESTISQGLLLATLAYRYGIAIAALPVIGLVAWLIYGISRAHRLGCTLGRLLAQAILFVFAAQSVLSVAVFLGYPLWYSAVFPFLTDNTMAFLMNLLLAGLLASVLRTDGLFQDTEYQRRKLRLRLE